MKILCLEFFESDFRDFRGRWTREYLHDPEWLQSFLTRWNLQIEESPGEETIAALIELRTTLRRIAESLPDKEPPSEALAALNAIMQKTPATPRLIWDGQGYEVEVEPAQKNWDWVMANIAATFADLLAHGDLQRIKICENPYCSHIFFDDTKSRTKRWCSNNKCGNLWKLRRFRAKRKTVKQIS